MIQLQNNAKARIEIALYSAGRPLSIEQLIQASGTKSKMKTLEILKTIMKKIKITFDGVEIVQLPDGSFVWQAKPEFNEIVRRYATRPVMPKATVKTLSYIAYQQPLSSKELVEVRGSGVYSHLKELRQLDFIESHSAGRLKIYSTTPKFRKYFGILGDNDTLKEKLFAKIRKKHSKKDVSNSQSKENNGSYQKS